MDDKIFCQSCGMPMTEDGHFGTEKDGGKSADYCVYCYKDGTFTAEMTMDEMIDYCAEHTEEWGMDITKEQAIAQMMQFFPTLKRWSTVNIKTINKESEIAISVKYDAVDFTNMGGIMGEGYGKLWAYLGQCGKEIAGAPYCKYTNGSADFCKFDIELGVPVSEPLPEQDGIYMTKTCEGKAITAMHKGAYKDIEKTYAPMMQYLAENDLESTGVYYDYYLNNPADTVESELLTKVVFLIK